MRVFTEYLSIFLLLFVAFWGGQAIADETGQESSICRVIDVSGSPKLQHKDNEPIVPVAGTEVYDGDIISTLAGENVRIVCSCGACSNCGLRHLRYGDAEKAMATPVQKDVVCCGFGDDGSVGEVVNVKGGVKVQRALSGSVETVEDGTRVYFDDVLLAVAPDSSVEVWFYRASRQRYENLSGSGVKISPLQIPVGTVSSLSGTVKVQRATGEIVVPEKGDWLFDHDKVLSSADSKLRADYSCGPNINYGGDDPEVNHISKVAACCLVKPVSNYAWLAPLAIAAMIPDDDPRPRPRRRNPSITVDASVVNGEPYSQVGDTVEYQFVVENTGNTTLDNVVVTDDKVTNISCPQTTLDPGEQMTCTGTYTITQADVDEGIATGGYTNNTTANGDSPGGATVQDTDSTDVAYNPAPSITVDKIITAGDPYSTVGGTIEYDFVVENTGGSDLENVTLGDDSGITITCPQTTLAVGETMTCTATHTVTQVDLNNGSFPGTVTATGTPAGGGSPVSGTDSETATAEQLPGWTLEKSVTASDDALGGNIDYAYLLTNTGNVTISGISVTDDKIPTLNCPTDTLNPGEFMTCTGVYGPITQQDLDNRIVTNTATATGTPAGGTLADATDTLDYEIIIPPSQILIDKQIISGDPFDQVGDVIEYTYNVEVIGLLTVSSISVADDEVDAAGGSVSCPGDTLAPGDPPMTCTASYTVTQDDLDAGQVTNVATVTGQDSAGNNLTNSDSQTASADQNAVLDIDKSVLSIDNPDPSNPDRYQVDSVINYQVVVTNSGNVTVTAVTVDDPQVPLTCSGGPDLAPGDSITCTGSYTTTLNDVNAGQFVNTATADGTPPAGATLTPVSDSATAFPVRSYALEVTKTPSVSNFDRAGTQITYNYVVENIGTATVTGVTLTDDRIPGITGCDIASLDPGDTTNCSATYTTTQADIIAGGVTNTATVNGTGGGSPVTPPGTDTVTVSSTPQVEFTLQKVITPGDDTYSAVGDVIDYTYTVVNIGNLTIDSIAIADDVIDAAGGSVTCPQTTLEPETATTPAESMVCTGSYTITQADIDNESVTNVATLTGNGPAGASDPADRQDSETAFAVPDPRLSIVKSITGGDPYDQAGDVIAYSIVVTNDGNVTLSNVTVTDTLITDPADITCDVAAPIQLAPTESTTCTASYTVTQADVDNGSVTNTASADGTSPGAVPPPPTATDSATANATQNPVLEVDKTITSGNPYSAQGDVIGYSYLISNSGNITITSITAVDDVIGTLTCPATTLAPGDNMTCTDTYSVTLADVNAGQVTNTVTVSGSGTPSSGDPADATDTETATGPDVAELTTEKTVVTTPTDPVYAGATITYGYRVTNTGNITVNNITLSDDRIGPITCPETTLDPADFMDCTNTDYTVTQADINAGSVTNNTITAGDTTSGATVTPFEDTETVDIERIASFTIVKENNEKDASGAVPFDQVSLTYNYVVTNTGNLPLSNINLTDNLVGVTCPQTTLDPATTSTAGESMTCNSDTYTITDTDRAARQVVNTVTGTGTGIGGIDPADATDTETVLIEDPARQLEAVTPAGWWLNCHFPGENGQYTPGAATPVDPTAYVDRECKFGFPPGLLPTLWQELQNRGELPPYYPFSSPGFPAGFPAFTGTPDNTLYNDYSRIITP